MASAQYYQAVKHHKANVARLERELAREKELLQEASTNLLASIPAETEEEEKPVPVPVPAETVEGEVIQEELSVQASEDIPIVPSNLFIGHFSLGPKYEPIRLHIPINPFHPAESVDQIMGLLTNFQMLNYILHLNVARNLSCNHTVIQAPMWGYMRIRFLMWIKIDLLDLMEGVQNNFLDFLCNQLNSSYSIQDIASNKIFTGKNQEYLVYQPEIDWNINQPHSNKPPTLPEEFRLSELARSARKNDLSDSKYRDVQLYQFSLKMPIGSPLLAPHLPCENYPITGLSHFWGNDKFNGGTTNPIYLRQRDEQGFWTYSEIKKSGKSGKNYRILPKTLVSQVFHFEKNVQPDIESAQEFPELGNVSNNVVSKAATSPSPIKEEVSESAD